MSALIASKPQTTSRSFGRVLSHLALSLGAVGLLAGCLSLPSPRPETGIRTMAMFPDASVVAHTPDGYCIDDRTSRPATGFAVMGGCAVTSRMAIMPVVEGLITVQFGQPGSAAVAGAEDDLVALFRSANGAALLSSSGRPEGIFVEGIESRPGVVYVHFLDTAPALADGLDQTEWRAFLDISGRLTTVTVRGFERAPMDRTAGFGLLNDVLAALRAANPPAQPAAPN